MVPPLVVCVGMATRYLTTPPGLVFPTPCDIVVPLGYLDVAAASLSTPASSLTQHTHTRFEYSLEISLWSKKIILTPCYRACGATICNRTDELKESDVGTKCGLFEIRKHGDEYFAYLVECREPKACTIVLRGASKDILKEVS